LEYFLFTDTLLISSLEIGIDSSELSQVQTVSKTLRKNKGTTSHAVTQPPSFKVALQYSLQLSASHSDCHYSDNLLAMLKIDQ